MTQFIDGKIVEMTAEEIKEMEEISEKAALLPPSPEERLEALESALLELILGGSING